MIKRIKELFLFGEDSASEQEVIDAIKRGVNFRGAKLWILIIAVFVASLGLNINSSPVIIGAMLISPLMGPIIGMGLGVGIYDFELLRESWRNYLVATLFSILTATLYFKITPLDQAQSELLARTSPSIYDVLIALCGGLAGIVALGSRTQRTGNVIPGVAIATALMPPLCTAGYCIATGNWSFAVGALYLFVINTIFIALATLIGTVFIMKFKKKKLMDHAREQRVNRIIYIVTFIAIVPAVWLTYNIVQKSYFEQNVNRFVSHEFNYPMVHVVSHRADYDERSFSVVIVGGELDSTDIQTAQMHLPLYQLENVSMQVIQGKQAEDTRFSELLLSENRQLQHAEEVIAQQQDRVARLEKELGYFQQTQELSSQLLGELQALFPQVANLSSARGYAAASESVIQQMLVLVTVESELGSDERVRLENWMRERLGEENLHIIVELQPTESQPAVQE